MQRGRCPAHGARSRLRVCCSLAYSVPARRPYWGPRSLAPAFFERWRVCGVAGLSECSAFRPRLEFFTSPREGGRDWGLYQVPARCPRWGDSRLAGPAPCCARASLRRVPRRPSASGLSNRALEAVSDRCGGGGARRQCGRLHVLPAHGALQILQLERRSAGHPASRSTAPPGLHA